MAKAAELAKKAVKLGQDDPRRVTHSLKVGLALSLVSLFYYLQPLYEGFGVNAMWAVMTVVLIFEFHVGATFSRGLNRLLATVIGGAIGLGAHHLASLSGKTGQPIMLSFFVFLQAAGITFMRFFPRIKAKYDYGMMILILTFALVSVSGFREDKIFEFAHKRLSTVVIGSSACLIVSVIVCPVWAGEDLHRLIVLNVEKLANFLEGFGDEYLRKLEDSDLNQDKSLFREYKSVLETKSEEESLAPPQVQTRLEELCAEMGIEAARASKQLSSSLKTMTTPSSATPHLEKARNAAKALKSLLKTTSWNHATDLLAVVHAITVTSLLIDVIDCTDKIAESVNELASLAGFKTVEKHLKCDEVVLTVTALEVTVLPESGSPLGRSDSAPVL
ncbi:aluminum-activated malate transporter 2 [Eucalyptus grandis]|uniref:aluminum-activated malate transporter 2 n=1 Tax=Eucalyptus grandis TaxID=71139 RepID=UPI0008A0B192|nr:aluminum-activated malate transporter 2 [Eucalyptus grandis]